MQCEPSNRMVAGQNYHVALRSEANGKRTKHTFLFQFQGNLLKNDQIISAAS